MTMQELYKVTPGNEWVKLDYFEEDIKYTWEGYFDDVPVKYMNYSVLTIIPGYSFSKEETYLDILMTE